MCFCGLVHRSLATCSVPITTPYTDHSPSTRIYNYVNSLCHRNKWTVVKYSPKNANVLLALIHCRISRTKGTNGFLKTTKNQKLKRKPSTKKRIKREFPKMHFCSTCLWVIHVVGVRKEQFPMFYQFFVLKKRYKSKRVQGLTYSIRILFAGLAKK